MHNFDDFVAIKDQNQDVILPAFVGLKIAKIERELHDRHDPKNSQWDDAQNSVTITLDNGAVLQFDGWGYDASGLNLTYLPSQRTQLAPPEMSGDDSQDSGKCSLETTPE